MFLALGLDEEFWDKRVNLFIAAAPVIIPNRKSKLFKVSSAIEPWGEKTLASANIWEIFGQDWTSTQVVVRALIPQLEEAILNQYSVAELNSKEATDVFMGHFPHGSSIRQLTHYGQCIANKDFQLYDYHDKDLNMKKYG